MKIKISIISFILAVLLVRCASPGVPTGGDKDETPPVITKVSPKNHSIDFNKKKIVIDFDEFVKLKDVGKNVTISPPQKKKPKVKLKEKKIEVLLKDSLRSNTTYTIDFGGAIVDYNEGNPLGEYRYVFSTGNHIDSMGLAGYVKGAALDTVARNMKVALYTPSDTLNPYRLLPDYIAQTDSIGFFMFTNIRNKPYEIIAFSDDNRNNMLDVNEPLAFKTEPVNMTVPKQIEKSDSVQFDKYTLFKNVDLQLRMFKPIERQQYLKDFKRNMREQFTLIFNAPRKDSLKIQLLDINLEPRFFVEANKAKDSLVYWIMNPELQKRDTLWAALEYLRTDSLGNLTSHADTLRLMYKEEKKKKRKKKDEEQKEEVKIDFMNIKTNMSGKINYFDKLVLTFERPILDIDSKDIMLFKQQDTLEILQKFSLVKDSLLPYRKFYVKLPLEVGSDQYKLRVDSMKITDISGRPNKMIETSFSTQEEGYYGKLFVTVAGGDETLVLQVVPKGKSNTIVAQQRWKKGGKFEFDYLLPATYELKALWDRNKNGKWDTGDYEKRLLPEFTQVFKKEIELNSNWELEISWALNKGKDDRKKD